MMLLVLKRSLSLPDISDLRSGIDRLADTIRSYLGEDAIEADTLYLFCGRRTDRIKGLVWENDGYLLLYKRLEAGQFSGQGQNPKSVLLLSSSFAGLWKDSRLIPKSR